MSKKKALGKDPLLPWIKSTESGGWRTTARPVEQGRSSTAETPEPERIPDPSTALGAVSLSNREDPPQQFDDYRGPVGGSSRGMAVAPRRSWPFVSIIVIDMLLLLLLGYLGYRDLGEKINAAQARSVPAEQIEDLRNRVRKLEESGLFGTPAPKAGNPPAARPARRR